VAGLLSIGSVPCKGVGNMLTRDEWRAFDRIFHRRTTQLDGGWCPSCQQTAGYTGHRLVSLPAVARDGTATLVRLALVRCAHCAAVTMVDLDAYDLAGGGFDVDPLRD